MNPKHKLYMLVCATLIVLGLLAWAISTHNTVAIVVDVLLVFYYIPHYISVIRAMKRGKRVYW